MNAEEILAQVGGEHAPPENWAVFPLQRKRVVLGLAGWAFGTIMGLGLFLAIAFAVIPYNYQHGVFKALVTTLFLGIFLFIGLGSLWTIIIDIRRLRNANKYIVVITPNDFVMQEGDTITAVPLISVRHVTARGARPPERVASNDNMIDQVAGVGENASAFFLGRGLTSARTRWKQRGRTPTTLAFVDARTDKEVIVATDKSYGDPFYIAAVLKQYAAAVQQLV